MRCRSRWTPGLLVPPGTDWELAGRCRLEEGHVGAHVNQAYGLADLEPRLARGVSPMLHAAHSAGRAGAVCPCLVCSGGES